MLTCLTDTIGLTGCGATSPVSGLFVNSLPGISIKSMELLADAEQKTYLGVWADIQARSDAWIVTESHSLWSKKYRLSSSMTNLELGKRINTSNITASAAQYRGYLVNLDYYLGQSEYKTSALQSHYIQYFKFYSPVVQAGSVIKLFDADLSVEIDSFTKDLLIGWNTIQVNKFYSERKLFIGVDSTNINSVELLLDNNIQGCTDCGSRIQGATLVIGSDTSNIVVGNNSFGLSMAYGMRCKFDNAICTNQDQFYVPRWYRLGSELMQERLTTERKNLTTIHRDEAKELKAYYDTQSEQAIKQAVDGIYLDTMDICLECDSVSELRESPSFYPS